MDAVLRHDWDGNAWQEHVSQLLRLRYGTGGYQQVPDNDRGDCGIEGFSPEDGRCFQCYAPTEPLTPKARYERHRDKITKDVGKFIANKSKFVEILAATKIRFWVLVVPLHDSKDTVAHCQEKTLLIRKAGLPYAAADIHVVVSDQSEFKVEREKLLADGLAKLNLPVESVTVPPEVEPQLLSVLDGKVGKLVPQEDRARIRALFLKHHAEGGAFLENLRREHGLIFEQVVDKKRARERTLELRTSLSANQPKQILQEVVSDIQKELESIRSLTAEQRDALTYEFVADWLLRCPLSFPSESR